MKEIKPTPGCLVKIVSGSPLQTDLGEGIGIITGKRNVTVQVMFPGELLIWCLDTNIEVI
mgnify:CR=1 FL=1|tara:strand:+ start:8437 stop:8616 length:180 start_codon:yes stop_codon:yes gene_type:complete